MTAYIITFRSFTAEIARVISSFATSYNAFIIKAINVQPAGAMTADTTTMRLGGFPGGFASPPGGGYARAGYPSPGAAPAATAVNKGGLQTVLKEQLLRVTLEVELVKLLPKS